MDVTQQENKQELTQLERFILDHYDDGVYSDVSTRAELESLNDPLFKSVMQQVIDSPGAAYDEVCKIARIMAGLADAFEFE